MPETTNLKDKNTGVKPPLRSRNGCLTCRHRKKKCDEARPWCTGCRRNNVHCQWESTVSLSKPRCRRRRAHPFEQALPNEAKQMINVFSVLTPDIVSRLLGYFVHISPRWMSTRRGPRRAEYLEWLYPAISGSNVVVNCILTIASADMLKTRQGDRELRHAAVEYYGKAVSSLRSEIEIEATIASSSDLPLTDYNPLAVLLLCLHETQNFTESQRILPHLNAATILLRNRIFRGAFNVALRGFLYKMLCYFFSVAAFSLGSKLSLFQAYSIFHSPSVTEQLRHGHIMGNSQRLFTHIFRLSGLSQALASQEPHVKYAARAELTQLEQELSSFHMKPTEQGSDTESLDDAITSELYRLACRIHINGLLCPALPDEDRTLQSLLEGFIIQLQMLPSNSPSHSILSWPLVVAGFSATEILHQRVIAAKLNHIYEDLKSEVFSKSAAFLRQKWKNDRDRKLYSIGGTRKLSGSPWVTWHNCPVVLA